MKTLTLCLTFLITILARADDSGIGQACRGERSCFSALDGQDQAMCKAYKENASCFSALDGRDQGWCKVIKEHSSCFSALNGQDIEDCKAGNYPSDHVFWASCGHIPLPHAPNPGPRQQACDGQRSCFSALDGLEQQLCRAYKEKQSCFSALDGDDQGWCKALKEHSSCFSALNGAAQAACEAGRYPGNHLYWKACGEQ